MLSRCDPAWGCVAAAALLVAGEACGFAVPAGSAAWGVAAAAVAHFALAVWGWGVRGGGWPLLFACGLALAWHTEAGRIELMDRARATLPGGGAPAYEVTVDDAPTLRRRTRKGGWTAAFPSRVGVLRVTVVLPVAEGASPPAAGETWRCRGWLSPGRNAANRYARHMLWVMAEGDAGRIRGVDEATGSARFAVWAARLRERAALGTGWCGDRAALVRTMLLGGGGRMDPSRRTAFAAAGTVHVFAISGFHVMLFIALVNFLLGGLGERTRVLLALPLVAAYVMLTGARPSAVRAALMGAAHLAAPLFGRRPNTLSAWGLTAVAVYAASPELVFDLGCTLSFAVMFGIALWLRATGNSDALVELGHLAFAGSVRAVSRESPPAVRWFWERADGKVREWGVSFAAWLAGAPIAAHCFAQFTSGGLVSNLVVLPLASLAVSFGVFGVVAGALAAAPLACAFNNLAALSAWAMEIVSRCVASWPGASVAVRPWGLAECVAWYAGCVALLVVAARRRGIGANG